MRFEYKIVSGLMEEAALNKLGKEGWELVSIIVATNDIDIDYYFKRTLNPFK